MAPLALALETYARNPKGKHAVLEIFARQGYAIHANGAPVGTVTSGTQTPYLKKAIGLGYVATALAANGTELEIDIRGRRVRAQVVPTPFYKRTK